MQVFTVKEVANYLNCSCSTIYNLVRSNSIPCFKLGTKLNFNKEAIDIWVHEQEINNMQKEVKSQLEVIPLKSVGVPL